MEAASGLLLAHQDNTVEAGFGLVHHHHRCRRLGLETLALLPLRATAAAVQFGIGHGKVLGGRLGLGVLHWTDALHVRHRLQNSHPQYKSPSPLPPLDSSRLRRCWVPSLPKYRPQFVGWI